VKSTPEITAENVLNRDFNATVPFEKWLTDVTEFKYYVGPEVKKLYLSANHCRISSCFRGTCRSGGSIPFDHRLSDASGTGSQVSFSGSLSTHLRGSSDRHTDGTVEFNVIFHHHINDTGGKQSAYGTAFQNQSFFHRVLLSLCSYNTIIP
ncbi:MAG: hypothetical protein IJA67_14070, partial [Oscillospiraceae bacterium]|nr:hypothetical protein [Oscillospiraceae bacterium]